MNKSNKKGFTLAELLIVVAIIAVLVAIAIPVFTSQLEKAREGVDAANIRAKYAEIMADAITDSTDGKTYTVKLTQKTAKWQSTFDFPKNLTGNTTEPAEGNTVTFTYNDNGTVSVDVKLTKD